ncbi:TadE/TadG family type IV pilus assembly protein [Yersinia enterocolitica]|uniref:TadE/TadG family type IV pilus assembly protein n=1 Tax=Yersinia enterocolitica TaxID=630 RepID=UPI00094B98C4|nr:pilus assembly protein [Yersinia enterocolitica]
MLTKPDTIHKSNYFTLFKKNEQGAILISFMIILPFFIALMFISFEISHYLQRKAKLSDAIEQATLALTVENNGVPDEAQQIKNNALVLSYANAYLPSERFSDPIINIDDNAHYLGYNAAVAIAYPAKFLSQSPLTNTISDINITDNGMAIKNKTIAASEPMDVVFVADYSSSMESKFLGDSSNKSKIDSLREVFERLNNTILKNSNTNTIGFIPFAWGTKIIVSDKQQVNTYCHFPFASKKNSSIDEKIKAYNATIIGPVDRNGPEPIQKIIENNIDFDETIRSIEGRNKEINIDMKDISYHGICLKGSDAYSLKVDQDNKELIDDIITMRPYGETLVSSGILVGNNIFKESNNNKLMIILSDGEDTYSDINISKMLIRKGMCEKIKANNIRMVFIGIGYKPRSINWEDCVGKENFYLAKNAHELEADLRLALGETETHEVGRNTPKN